MENNDRFSGYSFITPEFVSDRVLLLWLDRPEKLNACDPAGHAELSSIWRDVDADPRVSVSVVTGRGKAFCSGGDLSSDELTSPARAWEAMSRDADIVRAMALSKKPIISAINGVAVGAGLAVGLLADIAIVSANARLIDGHTKLGLVAGDHATWLWPLLCGLARAKYYLLTSREVTGPQAVDIGLAALCVPQEELLEQALGIAAELVAGSPFAVQGTKRALNGWLLSNLQHFEASMALELASLLLPDAEEGLQAYKDRRPPDFRLGGTW